MASAVHMEQRCDGEGQFNERIRDATSQTHLFLIGRRLDVFVLWMYAVTE